MPTSLKTSLSAWIVTSGEAGHRTQARGLALAVAGEAREFTVDLRAPWRYLPGDKVPFALTGLTSDSDRPTAPWPDLVVSSGRRAAAVALAIRRAGQGKTVAVHVPDPHIDPAAFDLVVCLNHDPASGPNVLSLATAVHDLTPAKLDEAASVWRERLRAPGRSLIGVLLGGATHHRALSVIQWGRMFADLDALRRATGARLAITPSRRTSPEVRALLTTRFGDDPDTFLWDMTGDNPYRGILALSDRLVVTSDSVSMVSEALATQASVEVYGRPGSPRHVRFIDQLIDCGLLRPFTGDPVPGTVNGPINATDVAATRVRELLRARLGLELATA
jgi:mitochondrial fission protein ELM1